MLLELSVKCRYNTSLLSLIVLFLSVMSLCARLFWKYKVKRICEAFQPFFAIPVLIVPIMSSHGKIS